MQGSFSVAGALVHVGVEKDSFLVVQDGWVLRLASENLEMQGNVSLPANVTECRGNLTCISLDGGKLYSLSGGHIIEQQVSSKILGWFLEGGKVILLHSDDNSMQISHF